MNVHRDGDNTAPSQFGPKSGLVKSNQLPPPHPGPSPRPAMMLAKAAFNLISRAPSLQTLPK